MIKYLLGQEIIKNIDEDKRYIYDECSNTNLPFYWSINFGHYPMDMTETKLTSKEIIYRDEYFREFVNITYYNGEKEILNETEYSSFNDKKDSKYKSIEVGAFENFFGLIIYTEHKFNGKFDSNTKLVCYSYDGQLIGTYTPSKETFIDYTQQELIDLIAMIKSELAKQEENQM